MRIKALSNFATTKQAYVTNHEYTVSDVDGQDWIRAGIVEEVKPVEMKPDPKKEAKESK